MSTSTEIQNQIDQNFKEGMHCNFNPVVSGVLSGGKIDYLPENFNPIIGGDLMDYEVPKVPDNFTPKVGGTIY